MQNAKFDRWRLELSSGEQVFGEPGSMVYMSSNMTMEVKMCVGGACSKQSGVNSRVKRCFLTEFTPAGGEGLFLTALTGPVKIIIQSTLLEGTLGKR